MTLEGFLRWLVKKVQKRNRCNFFRRGRRFRIEILSFSNFGMYFKVNHAFKAKKEAFRDRNPRKVKNEPF